ncbi:hypothetical protein [Streptomyces sp. NBC_00114]|uniref:hypothetical protein n=1 Tax=Streptomyces sp. NBC_00114 TaxID=2975656 RepID=UPI00386B7D3B
MSATPEKVDAVGPTAVLVSPFTASGTAAGVVTLALDAAFAPPRSIVVRAAEDRELTTFDLPRLGDERRLVGRSRVGRGMDTPRLLGVVLDGSIVRNIRQRPALRTARHGRNASTSMGPMRAT